MVKTRWSGEFKGRGLYIQKPSIVNSCISRSGMVIEIWSVFDAVPLN